MIIYKTTNLVNNKIYIGQNATDNPDYLGSGVVLDRAINKYGRENFNREILETCKDKEELDDREVYWIAFYNATDEKIGYNLTKGGTGGNTYSFLSLEGKKQRAQRILETRKNNGKPWVTKETREKISKGHIGKVVKASTKLKLQQYTGEKSSGYKKLSQEVVDSIIDLYVNKEICMKHIGIQLSLNEIKVKNTLIENNITLRKTHPFNKVILNKETEELIINLYTQEKLSIDKISEKISISSNIVLRCLKENKVQMRDNTYEKTSEHREKLRNSRKGKYQGKNSKCFIILPQETIDKILKLRKQGMPYQKICNEVKYYVTYLH